MASQSSSGLSEHPSQLDPPSDFDLAQSLSSLHSQLSSEHDTSQTDIENAQKILSEYVPSTAQDSTVKVLSSFLQHLPNDGQHVMARQIAKSKSEPKGLSTLSRYLKDAVLTPSRFPFSLFSFYPIFFTILN